MLDGVVERRREWEMGGGMGAENMRVSCSYLSLRRLGVFQGEGERRGMSKG